MGIIYSYLFTNTESTKETDSLFKDVDNLFKNDPELCKVSLKDNSTSSVFIEGCNTYGILVFARPDTEVKDRPCSVFVIGRVNDDSESGTVTRLISIRGASDSQLTIKWPSGGVKPSLRYSNEPGVEGVTDYRIGVMSI